MPSTEAIAQRRTSFTAGSSRPAGRPPSGFSWVPRLSAKSPARIVQGFSWLRRRPPGSTRLVVVKVPFYKASKPPSARQKKLRRRARKRKEREAGPSPALVALRRAMAWQVEIEAGEVTRADIARREGLTRARVTQVMSLVKLPDEVKGMLLDGEGEDWSIRRALREAR